MINIVFRNEKPEIASLLCAGLITEALATGKGDSSDVISEVSQTANTCTDEQELHMRHSQWDE